MQASHYIELGAFLAILLIISPFLGKYIWFVSTGRVSLPLLRKVEGFIFRASGINAQQEQGIKSYIFSLLLFSFVGFAFTFLILIFQGYLPLNPLGYSGLSWSLAFNTAVSFVTNTNWQSYSGEASLSYFSQMVGLVYQNFVSAALGISVCLALMRGIIRSEGKTIGNFWQDLVRICLHLLLPLSLLFAIVLMGQGVIQNFNAPLIVPGFEGSSTTIVGGPVASQVAIKMLGTNGGGFFNANAAHPFENPTPLSNFLQMLSIFLIPSALVFTLGEALKKRAHAITVWLVMAAVFTTGTLLLSSAEFKGTAETAAVAIHSRAEVPLNIDAQPLAKNMEGKEVRFGIFDSAMFASVTTSASCGGVNTMHDSLTPLGGLVTFFNMNLGEVIFGGAGSGIYGMLLFILLTVFIAGLMVGRTPDYCGKKIEGNEIKLCVLALILCAFPTLVFTSFAVSMDFGLSARNNMGAHGFSEILYAFVSSAQNNGSAFAGLASNTTLNILLALSMIMGRFGIMLSLLGVGGLLLEKRKRPDTLTGFPVSGFLFGVLLLFVIIVVGALTFLPALCLGPIAEELQMLQKLVF